MDLDTLILHFFETEDPATLTEADYVFVLDPWWNPAVEAQAVDRVHRIGQKSTVFVYRMVTAGTIEERIDTMINEKRALAQAVVGTGEAWVTELSVDELRDVISLRDREVGSS